MHSLRSPAAPGAAAGAKRVFEAPDGSYHHVYASHVLEHGGWGLGLAALQEWRRVLRRGGALSVAVPDTLAIARLLVAEEEKLAAQAYLELPSPPSSSVASEYNVLRKTIATRSLPRA